MSYRSLLTVYQNNTIGTMSTNQSTWETIIKIFALLAAICYLIGLLTVNDYLFSLSISDFSTLKPRLIYTGAIVLFSMILTLVFPVLFLRNLSSNLFENNLSAKDKISLVLPLIPKFCFGLIISGVVYFAIFAFINLFEPFKIGLLKAIIKHVFWGWLYGLLTCLLLAFFFFVFQKYELRKLQFQQFCLLGFCSFIFIIEFSFYLSVFGYHVYPLIPEQFGGGQPREAKIYFKAGAIADMQEIGMTTQVNGDLPKMCILFEGDKTYVLRIETTNNQPKVVQINKDDVRSIELKKPALLNSE